MERARAAPARLAASRPHAAAVALEPRRRRSARGRARAPDLLRLRIQRLGCEIVRDLPPARAPLHRRARPLGSARGPQRADRGRRRVRQLVHLGRPPRLAVGAGARTVRGEQRDRWQPHRRRAADRARRALPRRLRGDLRAAARGARRSEEAPRARRPARRRRRARRMAASPTATARPDRPRVLERGQGARGVRAHAVARRLALRLVCRRAARGARRSRGAAARRARGRGAAPVHRSRAHAVPAVSQRTAVHQRRLPQPRHGHVRGGRTRLRARARHPGRAARRVQLRRALQRRSARRLQRAALPVARRARPARGSVQDADARFATLREVLDYYNAPPADGSHELRALGLRDEELADLEHFLRALSGVETAP